MADTATHPASKDKSLDDYLTSDMAKRVEKSFADYHKWEESGDHDKMGNHLYDTWFNDVYKRAEKDIKEVTGDLEKELDPNKHGDKLHEKFADILLNYLGKAVHYDHDKIEFEELKERLDEQGLKGKERFQEVARFYNQHTGFNERTGRGPTRDYMSMPALLESMIENKKKGHELLTALRGQHREHSMAAQAVYRGKKWEELVGDKVRDPEARLYIRKKVLPKYGGKLKDARKFHQAEADDTYSIWRGLTKGKLQDMEGKPLNLDEKYGIEYTPVEKPEKEYKDKAA